MRLAFQSVVLSALVAFPVCADQVTRWNEVATRASAASGLSGNPLFESRVYAMAHIAMHDALNSIDRRYRTYALHGTVVPNASPDAAVAAAAHRVLTNQFALLVSQGFAPQQAMLDAELAASLALIPSGPAKTAGYNLGLTAANAILQLRAGDGWNQQVVADSGFPQGTAPGEWRFTPPNEFAFLPRWGTLEPFSLFRADQFRPAPPYKVNSKKYTADFNEVKALGGDGPTTPSTRTADQTQIASFWYESSPLGWNRIARTVAVQEGLDLWENGRLFALLNLASVDGYIANFDTKYHYVYWRPITAIRLAANDGNPDTTADPTWTPLLETPPVPDYSSGHAVQGAAMAEVLRLFFGTDQIDFTTCSTTMPPHENCGEKWAAMRSFSSFWQAAEENALSRILVGIHFRNATVEGLKQGRRIAHHVFVHDLRRLR